MAKKPSQKPSPADQFLAAIEAADVSAVKKLIAEGHKPTADAAEKAADQSNRAHAVCHQKEPTLFGRMPTAKQIAKAEVDSLAGFAMVEALLAAGACVPERLCSAACAGNTRLALLLIQRGADVNYDPPMGTPLENAVKSDDVEILHALIKAGADVNYRSALKNWEDAWSGWMGTAGVK
jgi:hypothetical protein